MFSGKQLSSMSLFSPLAPAAFSMPAPDSDTLMPWTTAGVSVLGKVMSESSTVGVFEVSINDDKPLLPGFNVPMADMNAAPCKRSVDRLSAVRPLALRACGKIAVCWPECPPVSYPYGLCVFFPQGLKKCLSQ